MVSVPSSSSRVTAEGGGIYEEMVRARLSQCIMGYTEWTVEGAG